MYGPGDWVWSTGHISLVTLVSKQFATFLCFILLFLLVKIFLVCGGYKDGQTFLGESMEE